VQDVTTTSDGCCSPVTPVGVGQISQASFAKQPSSAKASPQRMHTCIVSSHRVHQSLKSPGQAPQYSACLSSHLHMFKVSHPHSPFDVCHPPVWKSSLVCRLKHYSYQCSACCFKLQTQAMCKGKSGEADSRRYLFPIIYAFVYTTQSQGCSCAQ
jgi:hypothetical protein